MKNRKFVIVCLCLCGFIFLAAASILIQQQAARTYVMKYVKKECAEDFTLLSTTPVQDTFNGSTLYTFETTRRKFIFTATATQKGNSLFPDVTCDYKRTVRYLYSKRIYKELLQCPCYSKTTDGLTSFPDMPFVAFSIGSYSDLKEAAATLDKCNQIYAEELVYNSPEFLRENPICDVRISLEMNDKTRHAAPRDFFYGTIDGNTEELLPTLSLSYAQIFKDYPDAAPGDIPEKFMNTVHVSNLHIILNKESLNPDNFGYCWYNQSTNNYMVSLFVGTSSLLVYDYLDLLDIDYTVDSGWTTVCWESKEGKWELKRRQDEDSNLLREGMQLTKDGSPISLTESKEDDSCYIIVSVPVSDFACMFDLSYAIDEEKQEVTFTKNTLNNAYKKNP